MKNYVRFAYKCILVALPFILVIAFTLCFPFAYMDNEYPGRAYTRDVINGNEDYDTLILGDSRAMADILPTSFESAVNLANGGATAIENYYYLSDYIKKHGAPKRVVIGFAPFHYTQIDNFWNRTVYFNDLTIGQMCEVRREASKAGKNFSDAGFDGSCVVVSGGDTADLISNRLRLPHVYMPALINSHFIGRYSENKEMYRSISDAKGHQLYGTDDGSSDLNYEVNYTGMDENADSALIQKYLVLLMNLCEANGIETYVISLPMNESSYSKLQDSYIVSLSMFLRSLGDLYPSSTVEMEQICYPDEMFGDSSHLNEKGADRFTNELKEKYGF